MTMRQDHVLVLLVVVADAVEAIDDVVVVDAVVAEATDDVVVVVAEAADAVVVGVGAVGNV